MFRPSPAFSFGCLSRSDPWPLLLSSVAGCAVRSLRCPPGHAQESAPGDSYARSNRRHLLMLADRNLWL